MPRLRQLSRSVANAAGNVPIELDSREHPVWASEIATREWLATHGLVARSGGDDLLSYGPANRFMVAATAWAFSCGLSVRTTSGFSRTFDARIRALGVPFYDSEEEALERWEIVNNDERTTKHA